MSEMVNLYADGNSLDVHLESIEAAENLPALQLWLDRCRRYLEMEVLVG